jgi:hypothetical protein
MALNPIDVVSNVAFGVSNSANALSRRTTIAIKVFSQMKSELPPKCPELNPVSRRRAGGSHRKRRARDPGVGLDPVRLQSIGLTPLDVSRQLRGSNLSGKVRPSEFSSGRVRVPMRTRLAESWLIQYSRGNTGSWTAALSAVAARTP